MSKIEHPDAVLNFRGVQCPYNYVKTKLALEEMDLGSVVEVIVDEGEPARHVPASITADGQQVLDMRQDESGAFHIFIQKTSEYK